VPLYFWSCWSGCPPNEHIDRFNRSFYFIFLYSERLNRSSRNVYAWWTWSFSWWGSLRFYVWWGGGEPSRLCVKGSLMSFFRLLQSSNCFYDWLKENYIKDLSVKLRQVAYRTRWIIFILYFFWKIMVG
jgi:hypothetical protein